MAKTTTAPPPASDKPLAKVKRGTMESQVITVEALSTGSKSAEIADRLALSRDTEGAESPEPAEIEKDPTTAAEAARIMVLKEVAEGEQA